MYTFDKTSYAQKETISTYEIDQIGNVLNKFQPNMPYPTQLEKIRKRCKNPKKSL